MTVQLGPLPKFPCPVLPAYTNQHAHEAHPNGAYVALA